MTERNLNLEDSQIDFIRLIMRSPDNGEGWRSVSSELRKFVEDMINQRPEIYETKVEDETFMLRLSERGSVLADYV